MISPELARFTTDLKQWAKRNPGKRGKICHAVGEQFSEAGENETYRNVKLYQFLKEKTGYTTNSLLHSVIHAGKERSGGRIETHIALYYLAKTDATYAAYVPEIEAEIFENGRTFLDIFKWTPSLQTVPLPPILPESSPVSPVPQFRLRPPGVHSHPSHFSNRAIEKIVGREAEMEALRRFTSSEPGFRWLQIAGAGGQGKSRMAYDLIEQVGHDWEAGFLTKLNLDHFQGIQGSYILDCWKSWNPKKPHLIVIDDLIGWEDEIGHAMDDMADRSGQFEVPVCVVLVERQRWDRGALDTLSSNARRSDGVLQCRDAEADWFVRMNLRDGRMRNDLSSDRFRFLSGVVELLALPPEKLVAIVRQLIPEGREIVQSDDFIKMKLGQIDRLGTPLIGYFLSSALLDESDTDWTRSTVLRNAFEEHYRRRWHGSWGVRPKLSDDTPALRLALLATMVGQVDCRRLAGELGLQSIDSLTRYQALALTGSPIDGDSLGPGEMVQALEPDILGEWFAISALDRSGIYRDIIVLAWKISSSNFMKFVARTLHDFPESHATKRFVHELIEIGIPDEHSTSFATYLAHSMLNNSMEIPDKLIDALEVAAKDRLSGADFVLGTIFSSDNYGKTNQEVAFLYYLNGALSGDSGAMERLANCHLRGLGTPHDKSEAMFWLNESILSGYGEAMFQRGLYLLHDVHCAERAFEWFKAAGSKRHGNGALYTMLCYISGIGISQDEYRAKLWYIKCCDIMPEHVVNKFLSDYIANSKNSSL